MAAPGEGLDGFDDERPGLVEVEGGSVSASGLVDQAAKDQRHLDEVLAEDPRVTAHLTSDEIDRLFDPLAYQGVAQAFIDRLIDASRKR